jgi:3-oxoacyl-[acyl-carrier protein] reductase
LDRNQKTALVTGSGSGIGRAIARELARAGYILTVNDLNPEGGQETVALIRAAGGEAEFFQADVSDPDQVAAMFAAVADRCGGLEVLVNNAGLPGRFSLVADMTDQTWLKTINVHLNGTFFCLREAAGMMIPRRSGRIVNIASIAGLNGTVGSGEYGAAKAGVINLTKTTAKEMAAFGITVNAIAPGMVATPTNLELQAKGSPFIDTAVDSTPTGRMTTPEEIAGLVAFLISPAAANLTGQVITMDGAAALSMSMDKFMHFLVTRKSPLLPGEKDGKTGAAGEGRTDEKGENR